MLDSSTPCWKLFGGASTRTGKYAGRIANKGMRLPGTAGTVDGDKKEKIKKHESWKSLPNIQINNILTYHHVGNCKVSYCNDMLPAHHRENESLFKNLKDFYDGIEWQCTMNARNKVWTALIALVCDL